VTEVAVSIVNAAPAPEAFCTLQGPDDLTPEQVRDQRPDDLFLLTRDGEPVGRASLWWRAVAPYKHERLGVIGHYAARDADAARDTLRAACGRLADAGCSLAVAPMDGSTWHRYRLITQRGTEPPFFLEPDNPDGWPRDFAQEGFAPLAHYFSALNPDISRCRFPTAQAAQLAVQGYTLRNLSTIDLAGELHLLWQIADRAFEHNFLYTPIPESGFRALYAPLLGHIDPRLVLVAEFRGRGIGFCFAVPDLLQRRRGETVDTVIVKTIAVIPEHRRRGLGALMFARIMETARDLGMRRAIAALMHEDNPSRRLDRELMREMRRYTLFARKL
jgi:GNAT superfamily N-acetyltransferase